MRLPHQRPVVLLLVALALSGAAILTWSRVFARAARGRRTIVLVTVDTLRRDYVGAYGSRSPAATPRMDRLAATGTRFADARAPAPLTLPSHVTMMTGLPPTMHGVRTNSASRVPPKEKRAWRLLAERMAEDGRRCGAFVSAGPLTRRYGLDAGFETYDDGDLDDLTGVLFAERAGVDTVSKALDWVRGLPTSARLFLWVHLFEPHEPHPDGLTQTEGYKADVEAADAVVGMLVDGLAAAGRGEATILLASDHGEALGDLGEPSHGFLLPESVLRVPLLLSGPGVGEGRVRDDPASLADVAPTLLALAGLDASVGAEGPGVGVDLLAGAASRDRARPAESLHANHQFRWAQLSCVQRGRWKLEDRGAGRERLYRLTDEAPWQDAGVPVAGRPEAESLAEALRAYRATERAAGPGPSEAPIGYGAGGAVGPFEEARENARRPDPYEVIGDAAILTDASAARELPPPFLDARLAGLAALEARDPGNPAVCFWKGYYASRRGDWKTATAAFDRALALGRVDGDTLRLDMGSWANLGDRKTALARLTTYEKRLYPDVRLYLLAADLWSDEGRADLSDEACRRARAAARGRKDEDRLAKGRCK